MVETASYFPSVWVRWSAFLASASVAVKTAILRMDRARPHLLFYQPNAVLVPPRNGRTQDGQLVEPMNEPQAAGLRGTQPISVSVYTRGTRSTLSLSKKLVPALRWPFPVIVQCCETEKAMCVDAKVNLAHRNYYCGSQASGCEGFLRYSCRKIAGEHPKQHCGLSRV